MRTVALGLLQHACVADPETNLRCTLAQAGAAAQRQRLAALEDELGRLRQLGVTQREQLMLQTADKLIAERRRRGDAKVPGHLADLMADLWNRS